MIGRRKARLIASTLAALVATLALAAGAAQADGRGNPNPGVVPPNAQYRRLSAEWWQWALSQPVHRNALFDLTGADAANGQPDEDNIFFLAGLISLNSGLDASVERTISVPAGTRLFFPILNSEADIPSSSTGAKTVAQLRAEAAFFASQIQSLFVTVDGRPLRNLTDYQTISPVFSYMLPAHDNILQFFGLDVSGRVSPAVGDGYYILLDPLRRGRHTITFGGTTRTLDADGNPALFSLRVTYHITVARDHDHDDD